MAAKSFFFTISLLTFLLPIPSLSTSLNLWPKPTSISWPSPLFTPLSPSFSIQPLNFNPSSHKPLSLSITRYTRLILSENHHPIVSQTVNLLSSASLRTLHLSIADLSAPLQSHVDESYLLEIYSPNATLTAQTPWGIMRGLETFSQLVLVNDWRSPVVVPTGLQVHDKPLFTHRGLLLDTSRNFYPVRDILRTIRAMGYNKMNVFHWHITDSQSFPIVLNSEPGLGVNGSYGPDKSYSTRDVRRVIRYGFSWGVRVVPEIDMPGHTGSWAEAYPNIITCANMFWAPTNKPSLAAEPGTGQLNPLLPETYRVVKNVLTDISSLFPDPYLHAGADEVNSACWESDTGISRFISAGGTHDELLEIFINNTCPYITETLKKTVVYWEDVLLGPNVKVRSELLDPERVILQTWNNGPKNTKRIVQAGYRVIVSSYDFYYLDCGFGGWVGNDSRYDRQEKDEPGKPFNYEGGNGGSWCNPFKSWQRVYDYDILHGLYYNLIFFIYYVTFRNKIERKRDKLTETESKLVLGGELALWSEQSDWTVVDSKLWPRASAAAETLWSGNRGKDGRKRYAEATDRLNEWRYRMVGRGIRAEPIQPLWCPLHPGMCDLAQ